MVGPFPIEGADGTGIRTSCGRSDRDRPPHRSQGGERVYSGTNVGASGVKAALVHETGAIVATWRRKISALWWLLEITGCLVRRDRAAANIRPSGPARKHRQPPRLAAAP